MKYSAYPQYKDSGVAWLGKVPEHWKVISAKTCYSIQLGKMLQTKPESSMDKELNYLKALHVTWIGVITDNLPVMWCSKIDIEKYTVKNGDLLVCEGGEVGRSSILQNLKVPCIIQNALHRVRNTNLGDIIFFCYLLKNISDSGWFDIVCNKATIAHLTYEKLGALQIPVPSLSEQHAIANFLNKKTAQIDTLIEKKKALIEKLNEKRIALITKAVTKGLDDSVPTKDSGVAWLGKVPEHWKIISAKICYNIQLGKMLQTKPESSTDEELNYLKALHVTWSGVVVDALPFMWCSKVNSEKYAVKNGDLLVCEGGEVGRASILQNLKGSCIIQNALHRVRDSGRGNVQFFCYLLKSISNSGWFDIVCNKATIAHLTYEKLGALQIPVPSLSEQQAIANFLDKKTAQINTMVEKLKATITKLEEYRTTIITAAVTGKIDVRNYEKQQK